MRRIELPVLRESLRVAIALISSLSVSTQGVVGSCKHQEDEKQEDDVIDGAAIFFVIAGRSFSRRLIRRKGEVLVAFALGLHRAGG